MYGDKVLYLQIKLTKEEDVSFEINCTSPMCIQFEIYCFSKGRLLWVLNKPFVELQY